MSKQWRIPVFWEMCGVITITADTLKEAIERAKNDDSVELPTGSYIDGSFALSLDDPEEIREYYNYNQLDEVSVRQAIRDFMAFEKKTCIIYPFASSFEEMSEELLLKIEEKCAGHTDSETIYDAIVEVAGRNPCLNDRDFVAAAFAAYEKKLEQRNRPLNELIRSAEAGSRDVQSPSDLKGREETHKR